MEASAFVLFIHSFFFSPFICNPSECAMCTCVWKQNFWPSFKVQDYSHILTLAGIHLLACFAAHVNNTSAEICKKSPAIQLRPPNRSFVSTLRYKPEADVPDRHRQADNKLAVKVVERDFDRSEKKNKALGFG